MATNPIRPVPIRPNVMAAVNIVTTSAPASQQQAPQPQTGPSARTSTTSATQLRVANLPLMVALTPAPPPQVQADVLLQAYYPAQLTQGLDARGQYHVNEFMGTRPRQWRDMQYAQHPTHSALQFTTWSSTQDTLDVSLRVERGQVVGLNIANRNTGESVNARCQATTSAPPAAQRPDLQMRFAVDIALRPELLQGLSITEQQLVADVLGTPAQQRNLQRYAVNGGQTTFEFSAQAANSVALGGRPASFHVSAGVRFGQLEHCTVTEQNTNQTVTLPAPPASATVPLGQQAQQQPTAGQDVPVASIAALFAARPPIHETTQSQPVVMPGQGVAAACPGANGRFTISNAVVSHSFRGPNAAEWNVNGAVDHWCRANNNAPRRLFISAVVDAANAMAMTPGATSGPNPPVRKAQAGPPEIWRFDLPGLDNRTPNQTVPAYIAFTDATLSEVADVRTVVPDRSEQQLLRSMTLSFNRP